MVVIVNNPGQPLLSPKPAGRALLAQPLHMGFGERLWECGKCPEAMKMGR